MTDFQTDSIFAFDASLDSSEFDAQLDSRFDADADADADLGLQEDLAHAGYTTPASPTPVSERPRPVRTLTNSPRCTPTEQPQSSPQTSTASSASASTRSRKPGTPRRTRPVQVSAWAVPASSVNWSNPQPRQPRSRARTQPQSSVRKAVRGTRSSDWALPF